jgi:entericidin A
MKRVSTAIVLAVFIAVAAGCNTVQGVGKDVQKAGEKIEDVAKKK